MATATLSNSAASSSSTQASRNVRVRSLLSALAPSPAAALLAGGGLATESVLATTMPGHALWSGGWASLLTATFLIWFWLTAGWLAWFCSRMASRAISSRSRLAAGLLFVVVTAALLLEVVSWGMYLQTGRFANWETVRFVLANTRMLWLFFESTNSGEMIWLGIFALSIVVGIPWANRWLARSSWTTDNEKHLTVVQLGTWLVLALVVMWLKIAVNNDLSIQRRVSRIDQLSNCLNPTTTFVAGVLESFSSESIEPCLDMTTLVSRQSAVLPVILSDGAAPSVIVIAVESLRHDVIHLRHQGREITPHINRLAKSGLQLTRAYSQSTHSDYADVCLTSSLYPLRTRKHHFYRSDDPWPKTLLHDVLHQRGYATAIVSAQNEAWGNMDQFLQTPGLDWFYHPQNSDAPSIISQRDPGFWREQRAGTLFAGKFSDEHVTEKMLSWIERQVHADRPFFVACTFQSSHFPYWIPEGCSRPFQPSELDANIKFSSYPREKTAIVRNAYYNSVHESDRQIGRIVAELRKLGRLDNTILVITGENGEAFHENGEVGHACNPVEPAIHVAAVVHAPEYLSPCVEDYPFEHVDLAPTILGMMGLPPHPNFQGIDVLAKNRPPARDRLLFFHVLSPIAKADALLYAGRWKYMVSHDRPAGVLFDLANDPTESVDVSADHPERAAELANVLATWRKRQLAYYFYPQYYGRFYPPRPPVLHGDQNSQPPASLLNASVSP